MEWFITEDGKYRIESLSSATIPGALRVLRDALCNDEYVIKSLRVNKNPKAVEELLELGADAALDGVSLVAVSTDTKQVVAAIFNKIRVPKQDASEKSFYEIFAQERCTQYESRLLVQFMANIDEEFNFFEIYDVDCSFEVMFLATLWEHRKLNLEFLLSKYSKAVARKMKEGPVASIEVKDLGPNYSHLQPHRHIQTYPKICQAVMTSESAQKIGKDLNLTIYLTVPYTEFVFEGKTFSERLGNDSECLQVGVLNLYSN